MCLLLLSIYPFFLTSSPSTVESSFLSSMKPLVSPCILSTSYPSFLISYFLPVYLLSISCLSLSVSLHTFLSPLPPPSNMSPPILPPSLAVYQASTLSSALWVMLCRRHRSLQCHHSAFKIQSFSETAVAHHLSSPPFWLWLRSTIGMTYWRPA